MDTVALLPFAVISPPSIATRKYRLVRAMSTGPLPFVYTLARTCMSQAWPVTWTSSTKTKIPRFTLFKKLASLPDTSELWSASSAATPWLGRFSIECMTVPSLPAKLIPRYARY